MRVIHLAVGLAGAVGALGALAACNSVSTSFGGSSGVGGVGGAPPTAGGVARPPPVPQESVDCPLEEPIVGASCAAETTCDYGNAADPSCDDLAICTQGSWTRSAPASDCRTCPDAFDGIAPGAPCTTSADRPHVCSYYDGTCGCVADASDAGTGADADPDGGAPPDVSGHWACTRPADGCPARRPIAGNTCVTAMRCDYGSCLFGVPLGFDCSAGVWTSSAEACP